MQGSEGASVPTCLQVAADSLACQHWLPNHLRQQLRQPHTPKTSQPVNSFLQGGSPQTRLLRWRRQGHLRSRMALRRKGATGIAQLWQEVATSLRGQLEGTAILLVVPLLMAVILHLANIAEVVPWC